MHEISIINSKTLLVINVLSSNLLHLSGAPAAPPRGVTALLTPCSDGDTPMPHALLYISRKHASLTEAASEQDRHTFSDLIEVSGTGDTALTAKISAAIDAATTDAANRTANNSPPQPRQIGIPAPQTPRPSICGSIGRVNPHGQHPPHPRLTIPVRGRGRWWLRH